MNANRTIIKKVNKIANKYNGFQNPKNIVNMYDELAEVGVTVGTIYNDNKHCEWYIDGEEVENSWFVYMVYKPIDSINNDYTIYFS